jgi:hypothetical protein
LIERLPLVPQRFQHPVVKPGAAIADWRLIAEGVKPAIQSAPCVLEP